MERPTIQLSMKMSVELYSGCVSVRVSVCLWKSEWKRPNENPNRWMKSASTESKTVSVLHGINRLIAIGKKMIMNWRLTCSPQWKRKSVASVVVIYWSLQMDRYRLLQHFYATHTNSRKPKVQSKAPISKLYRHAIRLSYFNLPT